MALSITAGTSSSSTSTSFSVTLPSVSAGDYSFITARFITSDPGTVTPPSGWDIIADSAWISSAMRYVVMFKVLDGGESTSQTITSSNSTTCRRQGFKVSGSPLYKKVSSMATGTFSSSGPNPASLTAEKSCELWLNFCANQYAGSSDYYLWQEPSGSTTVSRQPATGIGNWVVSVASTGLSYDFAAWGSSGTTGSSAYALVTIGLSDTALASGNNLFFGSNF